MPFKQFDVFDTKYHPTRANDCKFPEELSPRELSTATVTVSAICIVQEFLEGSIASLLFYRVQRFF